MNINYINIILMIIKEIGKYIVYLLLGITIYSLEKYIFEKTQFDSHIEIANNGK